MFIKYILSLFLIVICVLNLRAKEGMWLPLLLGQLNEAEMQEMGMKLTAEDIYNINEGSLKDAIVHFGGFCTSELISDRGLLLTNYHCGFRQIQSQSSVENNLITDGFWADGYNDELPNGGLFATFINYIKDVTGLVLDGVTDDLSNKDRQSVIDKNLTSIMQSIETTPHQDIIIKPFFKGNQYFLFLTTKFPDVRLVGTPPESIGNFGADTDNWIYPRHTGDFSLFRIYADENNEPAEYSEDNVPYNPKHFLPISLDGVEEGDFTLIFGFPKQTNQYLPSGAIRQTLNAINPNRILVRDESLKIIDAEMKADPEVKIKYASKFIGLANHWKKWIGQSQGLEKSNAIQRKLNLESEFNERIKTSEKLRKQYSGIVNEMNDIYERQSDLASAAAIHGEVFGKNIDLIQILNLLDDLKNTYKNNGEMAYRNRLERITPYIKSLYKNFDPRVDKFICEKLIQVYFTNMPEAYNEKAWAANYLKSNGNEKGVGVLYRSFIADQEKVFDIINDAEVLTEALLNDPAAKFFMPLQSRFNKNVNKPYSAQKNELNDLQRVYMKGLIETFPNKRFAPDANGTMRVTYGKVKGYTPKDGVYYTPQTYLTGVIEKYIPGDYEFDVDPRLIALYKNKDYGPYGVDGKMPVCFIGTNHTTSGSSGSPVIDAEGNLIGLNFDRIWEGTMSDLNYDSDICRNIMVDARYILFIIDKYAGASHLIDEMKLVHPKSK